jgi:hypothetical protein
VRCERLTIAAIKTMAFAAAKANAVELLMRICGLRPEHHQ